MFFFVHLFNIGSIYFFVMDLEGGQKTNGSYCFTGSHSGCISRASHGGYISRL